MKTERKWVDSIDNWYARKKASVKKFLIMILLSPDPFSSPT
jgi:hypothetical protein